MKSLYILLLPACAVCFLTGCISHVGVTKVQPGSNPRGLRYRLPMPVIVGTPAPDGTIVYTTGLLPDPEHEYAVSSWSFMAKHKAAITRDAKMLLSKVELNQDTTAVASKLLESAGTVGEQVATRIGEERTASRTAAKAAREELLKKQRAVGTAQIALELAKKDRDRARSAGNEQSIAAAEASVSAAQREVDKAQLEVNFAAADKGKFDDPEAVEDGPEGPKRGLAAGAVIYRILEDPVTGGVRLEPMKFKLAPAGPSEGTRQMLFQTTRVKPAPTVQSAAEVVPGGNGTPKILLIPGATVFEDQKAVVNLNECKVLSLSSGKVVTDMFTLKPTEGDHGLLVTRKSTTPPGLYQVKVIYRKGGGGNLSTLRTVEVN